MAVTPRLDLRQVQGLVMTPQLQQAIKLLQLSNMELAQYVEEELERNPLLERGESEVGESGEGSAGESETPERGPEEMPVSSEGPEGPDRESETQSDLQAVDTAAGSDDAGPTSDAMDLDVDDRWDGDAPATAPAPAGEGGTMGDAFSSSSRGGSFDDGEFGLEQTLSSNISLRDHLTEQLMVDINDPSERLIARHLIEMLDDAGYLSGDIAEAAETLGCTEAEGEAVLTKLQCFDPPGIDRKSVV